MRSATDDTPLDGADSIESAFSGRLDRLGRWLLTRPLWVLLVVFLALAALPVTVWLDLRHLSNESLQRQAGDLNSMISEIRAYYSRNIIGRVLDNHGQATPSRNYEEVAGGIPIPATLSIELGQVIGGRGQSIGYRFVSDEVFRGRASHNLDAFEKRALRELRASGKPDDSVTYITGSLLDRQIRMAVPVMMGSACVTCHNAHPESPKHDWKVGDVRGIQSITVTQPIAANIFSFKFLLAYLFCAGSAGLAFAALQWRQALQFAGMNRELGEANDFLASVSMKISKYLSPQVYKSIFSGERDAVIATERKKLTIFFSDIKDFTQTTERLQPEELTALLNEYFTEMAKIAHEYGATVDKFIGDAILAFFGDPGTKGAQGDAKACVQMALAMRKRLLTLNHEWRRRGIEQPFRARMGINTGYCNVGNFGSADRMDYTIIGAEANLAARLESIAEPGGITMSYETYALVKNIVKARALEPIALKGISREVVPYAVEPLNEEESSADPNRVTTETDYLHLRLDLHGLDGDEAASVEAALQSALDRVKEHLET